MDGPTIRPKPQAVLTCIQLLDSTRAMIKGTAASYAHKYIESTDYIYLQLITQVHGVLVDKSRLSKPAKNESHNSKHIYRI